MSKASVNMSLYNNIASGAGAADGIPQIGQHGMPTGMPQKTARVAPRPDMSMYEKVTGNKTIIVTDNSDAKMVLTRAAEILKDMSWAENEEVRKAGPAVSEVITMIVSKI